MRQSSEESMETLSLTLPLKPGNHHEIEQTITLIPGIPPRGIELIASIATRLYFYWRDTANLPIRERVDDRRLPFRNFHFVTQPNNPPAVLNPLKAGIASMWIARKVMEAPTWPGEIKAVVWDANPNPSAMPRRTREVGLLTITNSPLLRTTSGKRSMPDANSTSTAVSAGMPSHLEKRWLSCWTALFQYVMAFPPSAIVRNNVPPHVIPPGKTKTLYYACYKTHQSEYKDQLDLTLFANPPFLTYGELVKEMLDWITTVTETESADWNPPYRVIDASTRTHQATVRIVLDEPFGDGAATA